MRVLVCGDREWIDVDLIREELHKLENIQCIIHGNCRGADKLAGLVANGMGIPVERYPANWTKFGKAAGPIRNKEMLEKGNPDYILAFHDDIRGSKGTKDMVSRAAIKQIPFKVVGHINAH